MCQNQYFIFIYFHFLFLRNIFCRNLLAIMKDLETFDNFSNYFTIMPDLFADG